MKKKRHATLIGAMLLLSCAMLLIGCSELQKETEVAVKPMEKEESNAVSFDIIGGKDVMPITGFGGPNLNTYSANGNVSVNNVSDEIFQLIKDSGVNVIVYTDTSSQLNENFIESMLELCDKYEIGYIPTDSYIYQKRGDMTLSSTMIAERIAQYYNHDSWCGVYILDEPQTSYFGKINENIYLDNLATMATNINTELGLISYGNLAAMGNLSNEQVEAWKKMAVEYLETWKPNVFMFDCYPFNGKNEFHDQSRYITNLSFARKYAYDYDLPFWSFIQCVDTYYDQGATIGKEELVAAPYTPDEGMTDWNINTSLAYGAQGLQIFQLMQTTRRAVTTDDGINPNVSGLIGVLGNKTVWYNYVQKMTKHIAVIDEVLMNSVHKGVIIKGDRTASDFAIAECVLEGETFQELQAVEADGDVMIGCFNYNGKTALYVVNYDFEHAQYINLDFNTKHNITITQNAEKSYVKANSLTLDMAAGEGILLVIE